MAIVFTRSRDVEDSVRIVNAVAPIVTLQTRLEWGNLVEANFTYLYTKQYNNINAQEPYKKKSVDKSRSHIRTGDTFQCRK